ncbi:MAG: DUF4349 domain-containing protein [Treponema sp.]|jgi:hypothetical protein|nr:DUF4349 domain-containing protein [Treponema sp.]
MKAAALLLGLGLICCAKPARYEAAYSGGAPQNAGFLQAEAYSGLAYDQSASEPEPFSEQLGAAEQTRKLVKRADLRIQTPDPEAAEIPLAAAMNKYGAYSSYTEIYEQYRSYTIRVPESSFQPLLEELKTLGKTLSRSESAEDVTLKYYDLAGRLKTKQELRTTFQKYLGTAETIEEIMAIETRLGELQNEIDWMGTELRSLANLAEYATITLTVQGPFSAVPSGRPDLGERIAGLFNSFGDFAAAGLLILLGLIIYGVPGLAILLALYWLLFGKIGLMKKAWRILSGKGKPA